MSENKNNFRFIIPVDSIPGIRDNHLSLYEDIIKEFLNSNIRYAEVTIEQDPPKTKRGLQYYAKKKAIREITVRQIGKKIYLERKNGQ